MSGHSLYDLSGILYKWTNYWGGWQPRWFILSEGVLAYYNSHEEISHGCRASLNVSAGDVQVNAADNTRFDIVLQDGQHWYLKASTAAERQKWLIALGTAKARKSTDSDMSRDQIIAKMSELRLYCDALSGQAKQLKEEADLETPDSKKVSEISYMLAATCDTFLSTLENCMEIAENSLLPMHPRRRLASGDTPTALPQTDVHFKRSRSADASYPISKKNHEILHRLPSVDTKVNNDTQQNSSPQPAAMLSSHSSGATTLENLKMSTTSIPSSKVEDTSEPLNHFEDSTKDSTDSDGILQPDQAPLETEEKQDGKEDGVPKTPSSPAVKHEYLTFFTAMLHSFTDIVMEEDGGIPTTAFLAACDDITPFFDKIGSTAFAPVKMDLMGNIKKIRTKQLTNPAIYMTVQDIIRHEMDTKTTKVRNSATDAILWLSRAMRLTEKFLRNLNDGERNAATALSDAYADSLRRYHGWVVRGIFALAVKATPNTPDLFRVLGSRPDGQEEDRPSPTLHRDIDSYVTALDVVLTVIESFYIQHHLGDDVSA